jgi:hypothetical protein
VAPGYGEEMRFVALVTSEEFTGNVMAANPGSVSGAGAGIQEYHVAAKAPKPSFRARHGIQLFKPLLDSCFHRNDGLGFCCETVGFDTCLIRRRKAHVNRYRG